MLTARTRSLRRVRYSAAAGGRPVRARRHRPGRRRGRQGGGGRDDRPVLHLVHPVVQLAPGDRMPAPAKGDGRRHRNRPQRQAKGDVDDRVGQPHLLQTHRQGEDDDRHARHQGQQPGLALPGGEDRLAARLASHRPKPMMISPISTWAAKTTNAGDQRAQGGEAAGRPPPPSPPRPGSPPAPAGR